MHTTVNTSSVPDAGGEIQDFTFQALDRPCNKFLTLLHIYSPAICKTKQSSTLCLVLLVCLPVHARVTFLHGICSCAGENTSYIVTRCVCGCVCFCVFRLKHLDDMLSSACRSAEAVYKVVYWDNHSTSSRSECTRAQKD